MATTDELSGFVRDALARGLPRAQIVEALNRAGWDPDQVKSALAEYADIEFPIPVPRPRPYLSAREAFLYLLLFITLYVTAINLGRLIFQLIDRLLPDPADRQTWTHAHYAIRWSISSLIVAFPVFLYLSRATSRAIRLHPAKRQSKVRRWLIYFTLLVAAVVVICDVIALVYSLLGGELTLRFVLKALTVGVIAGGVLAYYLPDVRQEEKQGG